MTVVVEVQPTISSEVSVETCVMITPRVLLNLTVIGLVKFLKMILLMIVNLVVVLS